MAAHVANGRCRFALGAAALGAVLVVPVAWYLAPEPDPITSGNAARIRVGMSEDEVEAILGRPADSSNPDKFNTIRQWFGRTGSIGMYFDNRGRVWSKPWYYANPGLLQRALLLFR